MAAQDMKLISCRGCGLVMVKLSRDVCNACFQKEEELFALVRDFIRANPNAAIIEVAESLNVSEAQINYFVNSGRLERLGVNVPHPCQTCGRVITTGLICSECSEDLKKHVGDLKGSIEKLKSSGKDLWKKDSKPDASGTHKGKPRK